MAELFDILGKATISLPLGTNPTQNFTDSAYSKVTVMTRAAEQRGAVTADAVNGRVIAGKDGHYEVMVSINAAGNANDVLGVKLYKNGVDLGGDGVIISLEGTNKGIVLTWIAALDLSVNDYLEIWATNTKSGTLNATFFNVNFSLRNDS
jgi:hypothetical protein